MNDQEYCGCGKPVRYSHMVNGEWRGSCNKYTLCPTYDELMEKSSRTSMEVLSYETAVNEIAEIARSCQDPEAQMKLMHSLQKCKNYIANIK